MKETNVYTKIITDENLMETIPHGSQDYPFRYYYEHLAQFDFNCIDWHWHTELEFVYIQSGTVTAWIGEKQLELPADSGIFINSKFLHRFFLSCGCCHPKLSLHALFPCSYRQLYLPELCKAYRYIEYSFLDFLQRDFLAGQSSRSYEADFFCADFRFFLPSSDLCPYAAALAGNIRTYRPFHFTGNHWTVLCKPRKAPADDAVYSRKLQKKIFPWMRLLHSL